MFTMSVRATIVCLRLNYEGTLYVDYTHIAKPGHLPVKSILNTYYLCQITKRTTRDRIIKHELKLI